MSMKMCQRWFKVRHSDWMRDVASRKIQRLHLMTEMLGALSKLFAISLYSRKVCSCKYTRMDVNISENPLLVFQLKKNVFQVKNIYWFHLKQVFCGDSLMSWKCVCLCKNHGCCMAGEAFSALLYIQITSNQGFVSHVSCCFCCHHRQKTFQILFFAHRNSPNTQVHFLWYLPAFVFVSFSFWIHFLPS